MVMMRYSSTRAPEPATTRREEILILEVGSEGVRKNIHGIVCFENELIYL